MLHDRFFASESAHGHAGTDYFTIGHQVGFDVQQLLGSAGREAKACHYFIQDEDDPFLVADPAQSLQETRKGKDTAHIAGDGLDNDGSNLAFIFKDQLLYGFQIIIRRRQGVIGYTGGHSGNGLNIECGNPATCLYEKGIRMAMIAPFEFDDLIAAGIPPCEPDGAHAGFCAAVDHTDEVYIRRHAFDEFRHFNFQPGWRAKGG